MSELTNGEKFQREWQALDDMECAGLAPGLDQDARDLVRLILEHAHRYAETEYGDMTLPLLESLRRLVLAASENDAERDRREAEAFFEQDDLQQRIEQLEAQMQRARELTAQWRSQIDDTDDAFYARGVAAGYRRCINELEAALAQSQEIAHD